MKATREKGQLCLAIRYQFYEWGEIGNPDFSILTDESRMWGDTGETVKNGWSTFCFRHTMVVLNEDTTEVINSKDFCGPGGCTTG